MSIEIENYREQPPVGNLIAIFDIYLPKEKVRYRNLKLIRGKRGDFVALPSFVASTDEDGRKNFSPYIEFEKEKQKMFFDEILAEITIFTKSPGSGR